MSAENVESLVDTLRYRPVATTAAQMREAADLIERLQSKADNGAVAAYTLHQIVNLLPLTERQRQTITGEQLVEWVRDWIAAEPA